MTPGLVVFVLWQVAVVLFQFSEVLRKRLDPYVFYLFGLLPTWKLFTPRPVDGDWLLHYRTSSRSDASFSGWEEVVYIRPGVAFRTLFNPNAHLVKAMYEICRLASQAYTDGNVYYRLLLNEVINKAGRDGGSTGARFIQYKISWRSAGSQESIFQSNVHEL